MSSAADIARYEQQREYHEREEKNRLRREKYKEKQKRQQPPEETPDEAQLARLYQAMRLDTIALEELIAAAQTLSAKELHRLDKAVVVQKVAYKIIKRILAKRGYHELKQAALRERENPTLIIGEVQ